MAGELRPGVFEQIFTRLAARSVATGAAAMTSLALAVEVRAKQNLGRASHPYGTPTPAAPGGPPALVSGTLRRSVTHSRPSPMPGGIEVRVGLGAGFYPAYARRGRSRRGGGRGMRTPSSRYGLYLETGLRNGARYPFLRSAFREAVAGGDVGRYVATAWRNS